MDLNDADPVDVRDSDRDCHDQIWRGLLVFLAETSADRGVVSADSAMSVLSLAALLVRLTWGVSDSLASSRKRRIRDDRPARWTLTQRAMSLDVLYSLGNETEIRCGAECMLSREELDDGNDAFARKTRFTLLETKASGHVSTRS